MKAAIDDIPPFLFNGTFLTLPKSAIKYRLDTIMALRLTIYSTRSALSYCSISNRQPCGPNVLASDTRRGYVELWWEADMYIASIVIENKGRTSYTGDPIKADALIMASHMM